MSLAPPGDYDEEQSDPTNDDAPAESDSTEERTDPDESDPAENGVDESFEELQQAVEANSAALEAKADGDLVRSLLSRVNELQNRLIELEERCESRQDYLLKLEKQRRDWLDTIDRNDEAVTQLSAAVFGDDPECPKCEDGHLTSGEPWLSKRLVCSDGDCDFERKVTGF